MKFKLEMNLNKYSTLKAFDYVEIYSLQEHCFITVLKGL